LAATGSCSDIDADTLRTLVLLLYGAGLRRGEARRLVLQDLDLPGSLLLIRGTKFFKTRLVSGQRQLEHGLARLRRAAMRRTSKDQQAICCSERRMARHSPIQRSPQRSGVCARLPASSGRAMHAINRA
jgi:site-specific recombinase XerD